MDMILGLLLSKIFSSPIFKQLILANMAVPIWWYIIICPLLFIFIGIESICFWLLTQKVFKTRIRIHKIIVSVIIANSVTTAMGILFYISSLPSDIAWLTVTYIFTVLIEWIIYIPFFKSDVIKNLDLLKISIIVNLITYIPLGVLSPG